MTATSTAPAPAPAVISTSTAPATAPTATTPTATASASRPTVWRTGAVAGLAAAAATSAVAAGAVAAGVSLEADGKPFPIAGFAQLTLLFTAVGVLIASTLTRRARRPRHTWIRVTVVLTVLSFVPDLLLSARVATKLTLMATHLVAAAIVIPAIAGRLSTDGQSS